MLPIAACTQVITFDASFFPGLAQPWGQMSPSLPLKGTQENSSP